jgi:hypothetical protein
VGGHAGRVPTRASCLVVLLSAVLCPALLLPCYYHLSWPLCDSQVRAIPKLEDANLAGTKHGHKCALILTEGDSAKALAMAGLAVLGRDHYGVFPLRGKLLNVRDVSPTAALGSAEVAALVSILGLEVGKSYAGLLPEQRGLRYGRVIIMADQDVDGSHIKGLVINLFHSFWPHLLQQPAPPEGSPPVPPFVEQFITPVIKARKGATLREFYSMRQYEAWQSEGRLSSSGVSGSAAAIPAHADGRVFGESARGKWAIKYYKGLGTSTAAEGRGYFGALDRHRRPFIWSGPGDDERITMAFSKDRTDDRKAWIGAQCADVALVASVPAALPVSEAGGPSTAMPPAQAASFDDYHDLPAVSFTDFIDRELIDFSRAVSQSTLFASFISPPSHSPVIPLCLTGPRAVYSQCS